MIFCGGIMSKWLQKYQQEKSMLISVENSQEIHPRKTWKNQRDDMRWSYLSTVSTWFGQSCCFDTCCSLHPSTAPAKSWTSEPKWTPILDSSKIISLRYGPGIMQSNVTLQEACDPVHGVCMHRLCHSTFPSLRALFSISFPVYGRYWFHWFHS